jgi:hypothetical protein
MLASCSKMGNQDSSTGAVYLGSESVDGVSSGSSISAHEAYHFKMLDRETSSMVMLRNVFAWRYKNLLSTGVGMILPRMTR